MSTMKCLTHIRRGSSCAGTTPHTIAEAIEVYRNDKIQKFSKCDHQSHRPVQNNSGNAVAAAPIVDLLAIVTHVETSKYRSNQRGSAAYVRLWIQDTTSSSFTERNSTKSPTVQVLCFGQRRYTELIDHLNVRSGDILRFNRIIMMPSSVNDSQAITFTYDIHDPEIGPEYYRFGHVFDEMYDGTNPLQQDEELPQSMQTNTQSIIRLIEWYRQRHFQAATITTGYIEHFDLASLPCQHRTLTEFQSCIGLLGHLTVRVLHLEQITTTPCPAKNFHRNQVASSIKYMFVTLIDHLSSSSSSITQPATLIIDNASSTDTQYSTFLYILSQAHSSKRLVRLTNLTSIRYHPQYQYRRSIPPFLLSDNTDGIIIPTYKSGISLIEHEAKNDIDLPSPRPVLIPLVQAKHDNSDSVLDIKRIQSSILEITIWTSNSKRISLALSNDVENDSSIELVLSLLLSRSMDGRSKNNCGVISRVTIQLNIDDTSNETIMVEASASTLSHLFGTGAGESIAVDGPQSKRIRSSTNAVATHRGNNDHVNHEERKHQRLMKRLFCNLLQERVVFQWSIGKVRYSNRPNATTVNETYFRVLDVWLSEF